MREIDALVAEHIFGRQIFTHEEMCLEAEDIWDEQPSCQKFNMGFYAIRKDDGSIFTEQSFRLYSASIASAWEVVEKIKGKVAVVKYIGGTRVCIDNKYTGRDATTPMAICLAALKAVGIDYVPDSTSQE